MVLFGLVQPFFHLRIGNQQVANGAKGGHLIRPVRAFIGRQEKLRIHHHGLLDFRQPGQDGKTVPEVLIGIPRRCESAGQEISCLADGVNLQRTVGGSCRRRLDPES